LVPALREKALRISRVRQQRATARKPAENAERRAACRFYQVNEIDADPELRTAIRRAAGASRTNLPITVVWGIQAPRVAGNPAYRTTPSGKTIVTANSYKWPTVYHCSTRHIAVGVGWLVNWLYQAN